MRDPFEVWREVAFADKDPSQALFGDSDPDAPTSVIFECVGVPGVLDGIIRGAERDARIFSAGGHLRVTSSIRWSPSAKG